MIKLERIIMEEINNNEQEIRIAMSSSIEENIRKVYEATKKGCIESLKKLMEEDPYLIQNVVTSSSNNSNQTHPLLLHLSISHGHLEFTRLLLHHKPQLAAEVDSFQRTPLHLASKLGDINIVQALLEKKMSACFVYDNNGLIPLHYAVISGQMDIMQELIKARPRSLWMKLHNNGQTVLHLCVENNHLEGMKLLIETYVNDDEDFLNTADDKGNTILDLSIMLRQSEMVGYLLSIPEIKTSTSTANFTASNATKESLNSEKAQEIRNDSEKHKKEFVSKGGWYNGDWVEEVQGTMMLVATVIATVAFQAGVNPPGGVWQQDNQFNSNIISNQNYPWNFLYRSLHNGTVLLAGTAIFAYQQPMSYLIYSITNMVSFLASVSVILLIISRVPLKNRVCGFMLVLAMCAALVFLALGYIEGTAMVNSYVLFHFGLTNVYVGATCFMIAIVGLVVLFHVIRFLIWVLKTLFCTFTSMLKSHRFNHTTP